MTKVSRGIGRIVHVGAVVGTAAVLALMVLVVVDVALRYLFNEPVSGTIEYVSYWLMVPISFFGFSLAQRRGDHIDVPILVDRLPEPAQRAFGVLARVLFLLLALALLWYGLEAALNRLETGEQTGASGVSVAPTRLVVPVAMAVLALQLLDDLLPHRTAREDGPADVQ